MNLVRAALIKLAWRPAALRIVLLLAALVVVIYLLISLMVLQERDPALRQGLLQPLVFPGAINSLAGLVTIFAGIAGAAFGGIVAGSEWSWNTYRLALTRGESRVRYVVGYFIALALLVLAAWLVLYAFGMLIVVVAALLTNVSAGNPLDPALLGVHLAVVAAGWLAIVLQLGLAFAVSFITRSTVAGVAAVMVMIMAELIGVAFIPLDILQWAPFSAGSALVKVAGQLGFDATMAGPLAATAAYLVLALLAASLVARRSEVA